MVFSRNNFKNKIMKIPVIKLILSIIVIVVIMGLNTSCKKSEVAIRTCKVTLIQNLTNAAGDSLFLEATAGELLQNVPVLTRTGYTFNGWYANSADANPDPTKNTAAPKFPAYDLTTKPIYLDVILYARWIK
jgi:uncharacterized repeat protein (TIGR02543 family)